MPSHPKHFEMICDVNLLYIDKKYMNWALKRNKSKIKHRKVWTLAWKLDPQAAKPGAYWILYVDTYSWVCSSNWNPSAAFKLFLPILSLLRVKDNCIKRLTERWNAVSWEASQFSNVSSLKKIWSINKFLFIILLAETVWDDLSRQSAFFKCWSYGSSCFKGMDHFFCFLKSVVLRVLWFLTL